jgi:phosphoribosylanthranilate isomerase
MSVLVKICGVNSVEAADAVLRAGADFAGLVFHSSSPRNLSSGEAAALAQRLRGRTRIVAVVADASDDFAGAVVSAARPDILQCHGGETPERIAALRERFGIAIMKAIAVSEASDLDAAPRFEPAADMLLFDAKAPAGAARPGGRGAAFDWRLLRGRRFSRPWLLSGGLDAGNVAEAVACASAPGVDVSSGVETAAGVKSPSLIQDFARAARAASLAEAKP